MVRLQLALALFLAVHDDGGHHRPSFVQSLSIPHTITKPSSTLGYGTGTGTVGRASARHLVASTSPASASSDNSGSSSNGSSNGDVLGEALTSVTYAAVDSISQAVLRDEPDMDADSIARKQRLMLNRVQTYKVTLPLASLPAKSQSIVLTLGITLCQITKGRVLETTRELNLDTLEVEDHLTATSSSSINSYNDDNNSNNDRSTSFTSSPPPVVVVQRMDTTSIRRRIDGEFHGVVVSAVVEGSAGWMAGVRPGDILKTSSATLGTSLWPKSTLDGVKSAIQSRKAVAESVQFEFQRLGEAIDNQFELTLTRPIGLELKGTFVLEFDCSFPTARVKSLSLSLFLHDVML
jgi:hypothetical protein